MSDSVRPHRWKPTRLPRPWDSPGKNTGVGCHFLLQGMKVKSESEVAQLCPTLRNSVECSLPGSSIHGIFQARVLEWGAIAFSKTSSRTSEIENREQNKKEKAIWSLGIVSSAIVLVGYLFYMKVKMLVSQLCLTVCNPID